MADGKKYQTYAEFWPFYLSQHSKRSTRLLHVVGTLLALVALLKAIIGFSLLWLLAALMLGYGFAWLAHMFTEHNKPATFTYLLWSLYGDFHMLWLWLNRDLEAEIARHHIQS